MRNFDPYEAWLNIPREQCRGNYYHLLGVSLYENDPNVILNASERQTSRVEAHLAGEHASLARVILSEINRAVLCFLNTDTKAAYDASLRERLGKNATEIKSDSNENLMDFVSRIPTSQRKNPKPTGGLPARTNQLGARKAYKAGSRDSTVETLPEGIERLRWLGSSRKVRIGAGLCLSAVVLGILVNWWRQPEMVGLPERDFPRNLNAEPRTRNYDLPAEKEPPSVSAEPGIEETTEVQPESPATEELLEEVAKVDQPAEPAAIDTGPSETLDSVDLLKLPSSRNVLSEASSITSWDHSPDDTELKLFCPPNFEFQIERKRVTETEPGDPLAGISAYWEVLRQKPPPARVGIFVLVESKLEFRWFREATVSDSQAQQLHNCVLEIHSRAAKEAFLVPLRTPIREDISLNWSAQPVLWKSEVQSEATKYFPSEGLFELEVFTPGSPCVAISEPFQGNKSIDKEYVLGSLSDDNLIRFRARTNSARFSMEAYLKTGTSTLTLHDIWPVFVKAEQAGLDKAKDLKKVLLYFVKDDIAKTLEFYPAEGENPEQWKKTMQEKLGKSLRPLRGTLTYRADENSPKFTLIEFSPPPPPPPPGPQQPKK